MIKKSLLGRFNIYNIKLCTIRTTLVKNSVVAINAHLQINTLNTIVSKI